MTLGEDFDTIVARLEAALGTFNVSQIDAAVTDTAAFVRGERIPPLDPAAAQSHADALRRERRFEHLGRLAGDLLENSGAEPYVSRRYAQALIEQSLLNAALAVLQDVASSSDESEQAEGRGLIGRVYKQLFRRHDGADPACQLPAQGNCRVPRRVPGAARPHVARNQRGCLALAGRSRRDRRWCRSSSRRGARLRTEIVAVLTPKARHS